MVDSNACAGEYTYTLKVTYNGLITSKDAKYWVYNACNSSCQTILNQSLKLTNGKTVQARNLDGSAPVIGLNNSYGKPGQWPFGFKQMAKTPLTSNSSNRYPGLYENLIDQFGVNTNPRYKAYSTYSFCNTFAGDVARAMGNPLPQKSSTDPATIGFPSNPYGSGNYKNSLWIWFTTKSAGSGWREVPNTSSGLQQLISHVNAGKMAIAINNRHVAVIRPWQLNVTKAGDLRIAQAGAINNTYIFLSTGFGSSPAPRFFIHD